MRSIMHRYCIPVAAIGVGLALTVFFLEATSLRLLVGMTGFLLFVCGGVYYMMGRLQT